MDSSKQSPDNYQVLSDSWVDLSPSLFEGPSEAGKLHHNSSEHLYYQEDDEHSDRDDDRKSEERSSTGGSSSSIEILQQSFSGRSSLVEDEDGNCINRGYHDSPQSHSTSTEPPLLTCSCGSNGGKSRANKFTAGGDAELDLPPEDRSWVLRWASQPVNQAPKQDQFRRPRKQHRYNSFSFRQTDAMRNGITTMQLFYILVPSLLISNFIFFGFGYFFGKHAARRTASVVSQHIAVV